MRAADSPALVVVMPFGLESDAATVETVGTGDAAKSVTLYPESREWVTEILFRAGDQVKEDDPLLCLDSGDEELARVRLQNARRRPVVDSF